jgi:hypothetical protein
LLVPVPGEVWTPRSSRLSGEVKLTGVASTEAAVPRARKIDEKATMLTIVVAMPGGFYTLPSMVLIYCHSTSLGRF